MSRKVFVSYKYNDSSVLHIPRADESDITTARHYVDWLHDHLDANDHIIKGEEDGEDMSGFKDETIESKLRDKIFDSTITVVLISKNMRDNFREENDQWIPWEISYSLKEMTRNDRTSGANAMLAVALPDETGSYSYIVNHYSCVTQWNTPSLFKILDENMFNRSDKNLTQCASCNNHHHTGNDHSYIHPVKWDAFTSNVNYYLDHATELNRNIIDYDIVKVV